MKRITLVSLTMLALSLSLALAAAKANFSGTWVMDQAKSEGVPPGMEQTMTFTQSEDQLTLENKIVTPDGEATVNDTYVINGKEVEFAQKVNDLVSKGKRTAKWLADGSGFESSEDIVRETGDGTQITQHTTRKWVMAADGKSFTVEMSVKGPNETRTSKRLFVKK